MHPIARGALAGTVATAVWTIADRGLARALGTGSFSDVRLLGRFATRGRLWPAAGLAIHLANGASFGAAFAAAGQGGAARGMLIAEVENTLLWPAMAIVDRIHPDRRDGTWPRLVSNPRVFAQEAIGHAVLGGVLGALVPRVER